MGDGANSILAKSILAGVKPTGAKVRSVLERMARSADAGRSVELTPAAAEQILDLRLRLLVKMTELQLELAEIDRLAKLANADCNVKLAPEEVGRILQHLMGVYTALVEVASDGAP